jgi:hypothetical protein
MTILADFAAIKFAVLASRLCPAAFSALLEFVDDVDALFGYRFEFHLISLALALFKRWPELPDVPVKVR